MEEGQLRGDFEGEETEQIIHPPGKSWFVGIGINKYLHFSDLNNAKKDIEDMLGVLSRKYELDEDCTLTLFDEAANRDMIIKTFDQLVERVQPEDKVLIYYSGHGHLQTKTQFGFWIPHNAEKGNTSNYIRNSTITDYLKGIDALK